MGGGLEVVGMLFPPISSPMGLNIHNYAVALNPQLIGINSKCLEQYQLHTPTPGTNM